jgi:predicted nuclease of predicted toxin-antitoxin system
MRFLVDECTGPVVAQWLRLQQHDVFSVYDEARGLDDEAVLQRADAEGRILITNDKDFGELIFREGLPHKGILLLRLENQAPAKQIAALQRVLAGHGDQLANHFAVVTESAIRISGG